MSYMEQLPVLIRERYDFARAPPNFQSFLCFYFHPNSPWLSWNAVLRLLIGPHRPRIVLRTSSEDRFHRRRYLAGPNIKGIGLKFQQKKPFESSKGSKASINRLYTQHTFNLAKRNMKPHFRLDTDHFKIHCTWNRYYQTCSRSHIMTER